jgi:hypothetical protein
MKTITKYLSIVAILLVTGVVVLYAHAWRPAQGSPQTPDTDGDCLTVYVTLKAPNDTWCLENCADRVVIYRTDGWFQATPYILGQTSYSFCMPVPFSGTICATLISKDDPQCYNCLTITPDCDQGSWTINSSNINLTVTVQP